MYHFSGHQLIGVGILSLPLSIVSKNMRYNCVDTSVMLLATDSEPVQLVEHDKKCTYSVVPKPSISFVRYGAKLYFLPHLLSFQGADNQRISR